MAIVPDGPACACGHSGCLEAVASGTAIRRLGAALLTQNESPVLAGLHRAHGGEVDADLVFQAAAAGDQACQGLLDRVAGHLGAAVASLIQVLNPQAVVLGGGVMRAENAARLIPAIQTRMNQHLFEVQRGAVRIRRENSATWPGSGAPWSWWRQARARRDAGRACLDTGAGLVILPGLRSAVPRREGGPGREAGVGMARKDSLDHIRPVVADSRPLAVRLADLLREAIAEGGFPARGTAPVRGTALCLVPGGPDHGPRGAGGERRRGRGPGPAGPRPVRVLGPARPAADHPAGERDRDARGPGLHRRQPGVVFSPDPGADRERARPAPPDRGGQGRAAGVASGWPRTSR